MNMKQRIEKAMKKIDALSDEEFRAMLIDAGMPSEAFEESEPGAFEQPRTVFKRTSLSGVVYEKARYCFDDDSQSIMESYAFSSGKIDFTDDKLHSTSFSQDDVVLERAA